MSNDTIDFEIGGNRSSICVSPTKRTIRTIVQNKLELSKMGSIQQQSP
jgi:hypothetical protein